LVWYAGGTVLLESTKNQQQFWEKIGKIGVAENRKSIIPMEVIDDPSGLFIFRFFIRTNTAHRYSFT
jgi:hypothetical protein